MSRFTLVLLSVVGMTACGGDTQSTTSTTTYTTTTSATGMTTSATTKTTTTTGTTTSVETADTAYVLDSSIFGTWQREIKFGADTMLYRISFVDNGSWTGDLFINDKYQASPNGEYTANGDDLTIQDGDGECKGMVGRYTYVVAEPTLTMSLDSDACEGRDTVFSGTWDR